MVHLQPIGNRSVHYYNISFEDYYQSVARTFLITHKGQNVSGDGVTLSREGQKLLLI